MPRRLVLAVFAAHLLACDATEEAVDKGKKAAEDLADEAVDKSKQAAGDLADQASAKSQELADKALDGSKKAAGDLADKATDSAKEWWDDLPDSGQLSDKATSWLSEQAEGGGIEKYIMAGKQIAPAAIEAGSKLASTVDSDTVIEPIFRPIDEGNSEKVDAAISDMPRTEVIDGLTIGFKSIDELSDKASVKERGYLVTWRQGDHLVGFVYRSRREIDLQKVVAEAPRLIAVFKMAADAI